MHRLTPTLLCIAGLASVPASAGADTYPLIGMGSGPLRDGALASEADIATQSIALAVRPDGVVAFHVAKGLFWVQDGRLRRIRLPARDFPDVARCCWPTGRGKTAGCGA